MVEQPTGKRKMALPVDEDEVLVDAPKAETTGDNATEKGRAERAAQMSVAAKKAKAATPEKPAFQRNEERVKELLATPADQLVAQAIEQKLLRDVDSSDYRVFHWNGNTTDKKRGQEVSRSKIRSLIIDFLKSREGELIGHVGKAPRKHAAEGRVIHAFMMLAGRECHGGSYDAGYVASRRGANENRGMVARGFLEIIGDNVPTKGAEETAPTEVESNGDAEVEATTAE